MGESRPARVALVGAGRWGRRIIATLAATPTIRLVAVASNNPNTRNLVPSDAAVIGDWRNLLDGFDLDGIIVASPPHSHAEIVRAAVGAGLAVMVEKPLTPDLRSTLALAQTVSGDRVLVDHIHLFHPAYVVLRNLANDKTVTGVILEGGAPGPIRTDLPPLWDYGPHDAALALDLLGGAQVIKARCRRRAIPGGFGESWIIEAIGGKQGIPIRIVTGNGLAQKRRRMLVATTSARYLLDEREPIPLIELPRGPLAWPRSLGVDKGPVYGRSPLESVLLEFGEGIMNGTRGDRRWGFHLPSAVAHFLGAAETLASASAD